MAVNFLLIGSPGGSSLPSLPAAKTYRILYVSPNHPLSLFHGIVIAKNILVNLSRRLFIFPGRFALAQKPSSFRHLGVRGGRSCAARGRPPSGGRRYDYDRTEETQPTTVLVGHGPSWGCSICASDLRFEPCPVIAAPPPNQSSISWYYSIHPWAGRLQLPWLLRCQPAGWIQPGMGPGVHSSVRLRTASFPDSWICFSDAPA